MGKGDKKNGHADLVNLSEEFLHAVRTGHDPAAFIERLARADERTMAEQLPDDNTKKAFWINIYNAQTQRCLSEHPELYQHRGRFFKSPFIRVAGRQLSPDDIEHGILRRSKLKWSGGYIDKCFVGRFEKQFRVDTLDYRVHFALNCGAKSCPPIAFYQPEQIDRQLDLATAGYLQNETEYDRKNNTLQLPRLMSWFRADFGGRKGMLKLLIQQGILPPGSRPKLRFRHYDWTIYLNHYKQ